MKSRSFNHRALDVTDFAAVSGRLQGGWPLSSMQRLADLFHAEAMVSPADAVAWQAEGEVRNLGGMGLQACLRMRLSTQLALTCQRCLASVEAPLVVDRRFYFVDGESLAERLDADGEEDVLAMTHALDLHRLAEDELLLALPIVPRHEQCFNPLLSGRTLEEETPQSPFSALAALKRDTA